YRSAAPPPELLPARHARADAIVPGRLARPGPRPRAGVPDQPVARAAAPPDGSHHGRPRSRHRPPADSAPRAPASRAAAARTRRRAAQRVIGSARPVAGIRRRRGRTPPMTQLQAPLWQTHGPAHSLTMSPVAKNCLIWRRVAGCLRVSPCMPRSGGGRFATGGGGAPPSMITMALPPGSGPARTARPHGVVGVGPRIGRPIERASQYEPRLATCSSPSAIWTRSCLAGTPVGAPASALPATPEPSTLSHRIWNSPTAIVMSSGSAYELASTRRYSVQSV